MQTYKVIYTEKLVHAFHIDANSKEEAEEKFSRMGDNGELDFSGGEVYDTNIESIVEVSK